MNNWDDFDSMGYLLEEEEERSKKKPNDEEELSVGCAFVLAILLFIVLVVAFKSGAIIVF